MVGDEAMIVAGLGFRHGVTADEIVDLVERALHLASLARSDLAALATIEERSGEPGYRLAAEHMSLTPLAADRNGLDRVASFVETHSQRVRDRYGVGSVAEAAALACAGDHPRLILKRIASDRVTCALARGDAS
ncbi:cobalamin biosynthesis protein [Microvirga pudoricolor]|uniref:cobalamin biosynthesis protein n=1 Tax=Microvirga pudoricolor TaxID=2778729 RepID=UPI0019512CCE|nr:cobalamin biosynthesis protein [Microvirga pudoricolor]MBM6592904.1 cobalamin biosynthesis protein [Microvirga pudoricolor]